MEDDGITRSVDPCFSLEQCKVFAISSSSTEVDGSETLKCLIREMYDANSGFLHNLCFIFECFAAGRLYGIRLEETEAMSEYKGCESIFMQVQHPWTLPAFCCLNKDGGVEILWVHPRARHNGFARIFAAELGFTTESMMKNFVVCNKNGKCNPKGYLDPSNRRVCNHWALTGFPYVRESHQEVLNMVLDKEVLFNPWYACAVCGVTRHKIRGEVPASSRGACGGAPGSARTEPNAACGRTRETCLPPCTSHNRARCSGSQRVGARSPDRASL